MSVVDLPVMAGQVDSVLSSTMGRHACPYRNIHDQSVYTTGKEYLMNITTTYFRPNCVKANAVCGFDSNTLVNKDRHPAIFTR